ncbi:MAG TPA: hypothetical protein VK668_11095 [Mucilaginibacter sp.]|nr:hypothetical protein [Mucilaginibacter sp.]
MQDQQVYTISRKGLEGFSPDERGAVATAEPCKARPVRWLADGKRPMSSNLSSGTFIFNYTSAQSRFALLFGGISIFRLI